MRERERERDAEHPNYVITMLYYQVIYQSDLSRYQMVWNTSRLYDERRLAC